MDTNKLLNQANKLLERVLTGWPTCPLDQDLLKQEIMLHLKQFKPKEEKPNKYRQTALDELIEILLREKEE